MVEKLEAKRSKREFLPPLDSDLAWAYFFDALKHEARDAYDELLGLAGGTCSPWASCSESNEANPGRVLVQGRGNREAPEYSKTLRPRSVGFEITFDCAFEEAAALLRAAKEVIDWERRNRLIDRQGRPHPRGFACAMNVIGAKNGNELAEHALKLPVRSTKLTVGQALSDPFRARIVAPCFSPLTESREDFRNRIRAAADSHVSTYLRHLDQSDPTHSTAISKRARHHFAWLVRYQVCGEAKTAIAGTAGSEAGRATVHEAVDSTAALLGLALRPGNRGGRPRGTAEEGRRHVVRHKRLRAAQT
jgi:hypothetical protein